MAETPMNQIGDIPEIHIIPNPDFPQYSSNVKPLLSFLESQSKILEYNKEIVEEKSEYLQIFDPWLIENNITFEDLKQETVPLPIEKQNKIGLVIASMLASPSSFDEQLVEFAVVFYDEQEKRRKDQFTLLSHVKNVDMVVALLRKYMGIEDNQDFTVMVTEDFDNHWHDKTKTSPRTHIMGYYDTCKYKTGTTWMNLESALKLVEKMPDNTECDKNFVTFWTADHKCLVSLRKRNTNSWVVDINTLDDTTLQPTDFVLNVVCAKEQVTSFITSYYTDEKLQLLLQDKLVDEMRSYLKENLEIVLV